MLTTHLNHVAVLFLEILDYTQWYKLLYHQQNNIELDYLRLFFRSFIHSKNKIGSMSPKRVTVRDRFYCMSQINNNWIFNLEHNHLLKFISMYCYTCLCYLQILKHKSLGLSLRSRYEKYPEAHRKRCPDKLLIRLV